MIKPIRICLSVFCICMLFSITSISSYANEIINDDVDIQIEGGLGIKITLINNENEPIYDTDCEILLDVGGMIIFGSSTYTIEISEFQSKESIFTRIYLVGISKINVEVQFGDLTKSRNGLLLGIFVIFIN